MDGNDWVDNGDGTFTLAKSYIDEWALRRTTDPSRYNDLDLYTLGLLDPSQVRPMFAIENATLTDSTRLRMSLDGEGNAEAEKPDGTWSPIILFTNTVIRGTRRNIALSDITALEGPRNPAFPNTQNQFKTAFIALTNDEESSLDKLEMSEKLARFKDSFADFFKEMTRGVGSLSTPVGQALGSGAMSASSGLGSGIASASLGAVLPNSLEPSLPLSKQSYVPLYSHSGGGPFRPLEPASLDPVLLNSVIGRPLMTDYLLDKRIAVPAFAQGMFDSLSKGIPSLLSTPVALTSSLVTGPNLTIESLEKPVLYSEWKRAHGIKTTDPFAVDPMLASSLPLLTSSETLEKIGTVPALSTSVIASPEETPSLRESVPGEAEAIPENSASNPQPAPKRDPSIFVADEIPTTPFGGQSPHSALRTPHSPSHTPLIWNALARRDEEQGDRLDENKKKSRPFFASRRKKPTELLYAVP